MKPILSSCEYICHIYIYCLTLSYWSLSNTSDIIIIIIFITLIHTLILTTKKVKIICDYIKHEGHWYYIKYWKMKCAKTQYWEFIKQHYIFIQITWFIKITVLFHSDSFYGTIFYLFFFTKTKNLSNIFFSFGLNKVDILILKHLLQY